MEKYYVAALSAVNFLGSQRVQRLIEFFGSAEKAWKMDAEQIYQTGLPAKAAESFLEFRQKNPHAPEQLFEFCTVKKIGLCSIVDAEYPTLLKEINFPPPIFYYLGKLEPQAERIAMVGTRHNTIYGERAAQSISSELAEAGFTIVSGAAIGIDTFSHKGALKFGRTVAVLGHGISQIPREKRRLLNEIAEHGMVMTEFSPNMPASAGSFITRNRIIAGLSRGVIVVEAGQKSGALNTASYAGDYGRDIFAVPGSIFSEKSYGCNELIRDGATLIKNAQDILEFYNLATKKKLEPQIELEEDEQKIFDVIPFGEEITLDEILMQIDEIAPNEIPQLILNLELKNYIVDNAGRYTRA